MTATSTLPPTDATPPSSWSTFWVAAASGLLLYLAFPPVGWAWLAWMAPAGWIWLARSDKLPGCRPYWQLYFAGLIHFLLLLNWVRLPHWSAYFGWAALSLYLAAYVPAFVGLTRIVRKKFRLPLVLAAPVVWTGLELFRGYFLSGFSMGLLSHSQTGSLRIIQFADVFGAYGISFVMIYFAACICQLMPTNNTTASDTTARQTKTQSDIGRRIGHALLAIVAIATLLGYGGFRRQQTWTDNRVDPLTVALIQGSIDTSFDVDPNNVTATTLQQYFDLTRQALQEQPACDLVVWPESMYARTWIEFDESFTLPADSPFKVDDLKAWANENHRAAEDFAKLVGRPLLVGSPGLHYQGDTVQRFNSAQWLCPGQPVKRYSKMHPVMFGEYIPGGQLFPWLYHLTPMPNGLTPGQAPIAIEHKGLTLCPNICYENTVPHLIRRHVCQLSKSGQTPDALVTVTNDGWFWGSSQLDLHLASGILRSVELRRPLLIAANTGFSASIDPHGRVLSQGPRRATGVVWASLPTWNGRVSLYQRWGDGPAALCVVICAAAAVVGWRRR